MRVLIVNTSERTGGAAIAASRLTEALINNGVQAKMLVVEKNTDHLYVATVGGWFRKTWSFVFERFVIWLNNFFSRKNLFAVSIANTGIDITRTPEFKEADVIHLQWINQGMLSLRGIRKILDSGKPVVWTMHDMWELTGICHYAYGCTKYTSQCHHCHFLRFPGSKDLAYRTFARKLKAMRGNVTYVAVSKWLAGMAKASTIVGSNRVEVIPNSISLQRFPMSDKIESRSFFNIGGDKKVVVCGAARIDAPIKGFNYLKDALRIMVERDASLRDKVVLVVFGGCRNETVFDGIAVQHIWLGRVNGEIELAKLYSAADVAVSSSLYETFGQTLAEAQSCGCMPVSFAGSGQEDIIRHKETGYLAKYKSAEDLADGIVWAFNAGTKRTELRKSVMRNFSESVVANKYIKLYCEVSGEEA